MEHEHLVSEHYSEALRIATKYAYRYGVDVDIATNLAVERLIKCAKKGDQKATSGAPFIGYVEKSIRLDIIHHKTMRQVTAGDMVEYAEQTPEMVILESLPSVNLVLDYKHRQILESRATKATQLHIATQYGIGKKRVQNVEKKIRTRLSSILTFCQ